MEQNIWYVLRINLLGYTKLCRLLLFSKCSEQPVPQDQDGSIILINVIQVVAMMDPVM